MILGILAAAAVATPLPLPSVLWKTKPNIVQLMRAYPEAPRLQRIGGRAELQCDIKADGALDACKVLSESPTGMGFGDAALSLSRTMTLHAQDRTGAEVAGRVLRVPIRWDPPRAPPQGTVIDRTNFTWTRTPSGEDIARVFPDQAQIDNVEGRALVICRAAQDGRLTDCGVEFEEPYGYGFGEAAIALTAVFRVEQKSKGGPPMPGDAIIRMPIRFVLPH